MNKSFLFLLFFSLSLYVVGQTPNPIHHTIYQDCSKMGHRYDYTKVQDSINLGNAPANVEAVDLGLPSGTYWANMNIGATSPDKYGYYYAWGEIGSMSTYNSGLSNYRYWNGSTYTKYSTTSNYGEVDNKTILDLNDDVAHVNWGGSWRIPTQTECQELLDNCTSLWTNHNGVYGRLFTSKINGKSIFFPAAGCLSDSNLFYQGTGGYYWSSSLNASASSSAWRFGFDANNSFTTGSFARHNGMTIRPICGH